MFVRNSAMISESASVANASVRRILATKGRHVKTVQYVVVISSFSLLYRKQLINTRPCGVCLSDPFSRITPGIPFGNCCGRTFLQAACPSCDPTSCVKAPSESNQLIVSVKSAIAIKHSCHVKHLFVRHLLYFLL